MSNKQKVWIVKQTQPSEYIVDKCIYACSTEERARDYARQLNKDYGYGVRFSKEGDYIEDDDDYDYDDQHYYDYESFLIDEELA